MPEGTMKAVVFKGPKKVELEDRPIPQIQDPTDVIAKVEYTALCGRYVNTHHS
jgi:threonine dehydrogenase-like Zn-dependent dehydrogenase